MVRSDVPEVIPFPSMNHLVQRRAVGSSSPVGHFNSIVLQVFQRKRSPSTERHCQRWILERTTIPVA